MTWSVFFELLLGGAVLGGLYALMAFAFSLILATTHVLNVSHGAVMVLGAALSTLLVHHLGIPFAVGLAVVVVVFLGVGLLFEAALVRPLAARSSTEILVGSIMATFGLKLALEALLGVFWARAIEPQPIFALHLGLMSLQFGEVMVSGPRASALAFSAVAVLLFHLFLTRTRIGKEARAVAQNRTGALVIGVDTRRVSRTILTLGIAATALAGSFFVVAIPLSTYEGLRLTMIAFTVSVAGGVGNLPGALWAGLALGVAEVFTGFWIGLVWSPLTYLLLLFAVLLLRPSGILGGLLR